MHLAHSCVCHIICACVMTQSYACDMPLRLSWGIFGFAHPRFHECAMTATHCSTLQHTATHRSTLQRTSTYCQTLQHTATHRKTLQHNTMQHNTAHRNTRGLDRAMKAKSLQCLAVCCSVFKCFAVCCKKAVRRTFLIIFTLGFIVRYKIYDSLSQECVYVFVCPALLPSLGVVMGGQGWVVMEGCVCVRIPPPLLPAPGGWCASDSLICVP